MKIVGLLENTTVSKEYEPKHGLSLYIESKRHHMLLDVGPDDKFIHNAKKLGIDLTQVDTVVLSHGHIDHGGGLEAFLKINHTAKVYIQETAFVECYVKVLGCFKIPVRIAPWLKTHPQIVLVQGDYQIDEELMLLNQIRGNILLPEANRDLYVKQDGWVHDDFLHEQNLIIQEDGKSILLSGCSHKGLVNIVEEAEQRIGQPLDYVIGGTHLMKMGFIRRKQPELIDQVGEALIKRKTQYYTCHCTGKEAYERLRLIMGDQIKTLQTGSCIKI